MKICPQCRAQFEDHMNFCLQDGTPLGEVERFSERTENFGDQTLNLPNSPTVASSPGTFESQPGFQPTVPPTVQLDNQPTFSPGPGISTGYSSAAPVSRQSKSSIGLLAGALIGGLFLIGMAGGGVWWFIRNGQNRDVAQTEANSQTSPQVIENNSNSTFSDSPVPLENESETNVKSPSNVNTKSSPSNSAVNTSKPTPSPTRQTETRLETEPDKIELEDEPLPPPRTPTPKPVPKVISGGVVNGKATNLVKPTYPAAARAVRASGAVNVQVTIDEQGNVISASAVSGHPLLRASAVQAARESKFSPTILSGQPVKVTGVIVYNFVP